MVAGHVLRVYSGFVSMPVVCQIATTMQSERMRSSAHLNAIRSIAAVAVMIGHLRSEFWVGYRDVVDKAAWVTGAYAITDFANDAVCVFFVLSGYFIGNSILRDLRGSVFSWRRYLVARWTRLVVVLVPALLLTVAWDSVGAGLAGAEIKYSGSEVLTSFEVFPPYPERSTALVFVGNVFFLQCLFVPAFGSNSALWSLSYEWWYYLLGPVVLLGVVPSKNYSLTRLVFAIVLVTIMAYFNLKMVLCFPLWLMGCAISAAPRIGRLCVDFSRWATVGCSVAFICFLFAMHSPLAKFYLEPHPVLRNFAVAIGFSGFLYVLLHNSAAGRRDLFEKIARVTSEFSYSLYLLHLPLIICLSPGENVQPSVSSAFDLVCVGSLALIYSWLISKVTEDNTSRVRELVMSALNRLFA